MSKQLLILRHAKSDWGASYSRDFDRPLNKRGFDDAKRVGQWMSDHNLQPDYIICSPANRARSTLEQVNKSFNQTNIQTVYPDSLYHAELYELLSLIQGIPNDYQRVLLIGHNPGLEELLCYLSKDAIPRTDTGKHFTTANLALLEFEMDYSLVKASCATLKALIRPASLR